MGPNGFYPLPHENVNRHNFNHDHPVCNMSDHNICIAEPDNFQKVFALVNRLHALREKLKLGLGFRREYLWERELIVKLINLLKFNTEKITFTLPIPKRSFFLGPSLDDKVTMINWYDKMMVDLWLPGWMEEILAKSRYVQLNYCRIDGLQIKYAESLTHLDLSHNSITNLPDSLNKLDLLRSLNLSYNDLGSVCNKLPPKLKYLRLSQNNRLVVCPKVAKNSNLVTLVLSGTIIYKIIRNLDITPKIRHLDLSGTSLGVVPPSIEFMKKLRVLNLSCNKISNTSSDCKMGLPPELQILNLSSNNLRVLPRCIEKLSFLFTLVARNNQLERTPDFEKLKSLKKLDLAENNISFLPSSIRFLKDLSTLIVDANRIEYLPKWNVMKELLKLRILRCRANFLTHFPLSAKMLAELGCKVSLGGNAISLPTMPNIYGRTVAHNCLTHRIGRRRYVPFVSETENDIREQMNAYCARYNDWIKGEDDRMRGQAATFMGLGPGCLKYIAHFLLDRDVENLSFVCYKFHINFAIIKLAGLERQLRIRHSGTKRLISGDWPLQRKRHTDLFNHPDKNDLFNSYSCLPTNS